jgi:acyl-CoA synthetase (NDP forming)
LNQLASDRGAGLRLILGVGNEAVLGLGDMFAWAAADPHTKVVCTYIETMRDVDGIGRGLDALRAARTPVLVCAPQGRSEAARRSIVAHTGALAGNTVLRDAWLRGRGAILVEDPVTMFEAALLLAFGTKMRTDGVAAALQSGGACTLFAEAAGAHGLSQPEFSAATTKLRKALPHYASQNNPLDDRTGGGGDGHVLRALDALARPRGGLVAFDAFLPREEGEDVGRADPADRATLAEGDRGGVRIGRHGDLSDTARSQRFVAGARLPFLQGHRAATGAMRPR